MLDNENTIINDTSLDFDRILMLAKNNNKNAQYQIGLAYLYGTGVLDNLPIQQDRKEAFKWFSLASEQFHADAKYQLGMLYLIGQDISQDYQKASELFFDIAMFNNHSKAKNILGVMYQQGKGEVKDYSNAVYWFKQAVEQGNIEAKVNLGLLYQEGLGVSKDLLKAIELLEEAAKENNTLALYHLENICMQEKGKENQSKNRLNFYHSDIEAKRVLLHVAIERIKKNFNFEQQSYRKVIDSIDLFSYVDFAIANIEYNEKNNNLAIPFGNNSNITSNNVIEKEYIDKEKSVISSALQYEDGDNILNKFQISFDTLVNLASKGDRKYQNLLGHFYKKNNKIDEAIYWYEKAAKNGLADAQYGLGLILAEKEEYDKAYIQFLEAAKQDHIKAQNDLAYYFEKGIGVEQNTSYALGWYKKAAKKGYTLAQNNLGIIYENGDLVKQDYYQAGKWYLAAAKQGYAEAQYNVALLYMEGLGVTKNEKKAIYWLSKAVEQNFFEAILLLADQYFYGENIKKDPKYAIELYRQAISNQNNNLEAHYKLANAYFYQKYFSDAIYHFTIAAEQDYIDAQLKLANLYRTKINKNIYNVQKALEWLSIAAKQDSEEAICQLAQIYFEGKEITINYELAYYWSKKAADKYNNVIALYQLGLMYQNGYFCQQNYKKAIEYYLKSLDMNGGEAFYHLAYLYEKGLGIEKNLDQAEEFYIKAVQQNNVNAMYRLGLLYDDGLKGYYDDEKAREWYKKAARRKHPEAICRIGMMYEDGRGGVQQNLQYAIAKYSEAKELGCIEAIFSLAYLYEEEGNITKAFPLYLDAAKKGHILAQTNLALIYSRGISDIGLDFDSAIFWYRKAAEQNYAIAQYYLGTFYEEGEYIEKDIKQAELLYYQASIQGFQLATQRLNLLKNQKLDCEIDYPIRYWTIKAREPENFYKKSVNMQIRNVSYEKEEKSNLDEELGWLKSISKRDKDRNILESYQSALENRDIESIFQLAKLYEKGYNVQLNMDRSIDCYNYAANLGHIEAIKYLGKFYSEKGTEEDFSESLVWWLKAADAGDSEAQYEVGCIYEEGKGVLSNIDEALSWYEKAATQGNIKAELKLIR
ncbi:hypothetical protein F9B74_05255 [Pelistega sp. NLN82]|uniref:Uncharacterized protein n=1 Tax=Pelistega ratti TaxID=2652177 RepID=A0A6L9Y7G4_9BURK|nr:SEL1-like repeat protein [Pelistega ratti]NEN75734.1 hypothetical protein [Pelistega ratti]